MKILMLVEVQKNNDGELVEWDGTAQDAAAYIDDTLRNYLEGEEQHTPVVTGAELVGPVE